MKKVFVAGGVSYDRIIYMDNLPQGKAGTVFSSSSHDAVGGTGAGKSFNLEKLGFDTTFHAFVGEDEEGKIIKDSFSKKNIKFDAEKDENSTLRFTNLIDKNGNRISIFTAYNTFEPELNMEKFRKIIAENDYIVLNIMNYARYLIPLAKEAGKEIWCDIHDYDGKNEYYQDFIEGADYIFMSSEVIEDYRTFMEELIKKGKKLVVCTHGKNGATAMNSSGEIVEEGIIKKYEKVDTNGAGDAFFSGFLYGVSNGKSLKECVRYGTVAGGMCITSKELYSEELSSKKIEEEYSEWYGKMEG